MSRARLGGWAVVVAAATLSPRAPAAALDEARLSVVRSAGALHCPDDETLAARVRSLRPRRSEATADLRIEVIIEREGERGLRAHMRVHGARAGERDLHAEGPGCEGLAEALAVSLALLLDEQAAPAPAPPVAPASQASSAAAALAASSAPPGPGAPPPPRQDDPPSASWLPRDVLAVDLGAGLAAGLPRPVGAAMEVGVRVAPRAGLSGGARFTWTPSYTRDFSGGVAEVRLLRGTVDLCGRAVEGRRARLDVCGLVSAGALRGEGRGFEPDRATSRPFLALGAGGLARGPLTRWLSWSARLAPLLGLTHSRFVVDGKGVAFDQSRVGAELMIGLEALIL